MASSTPSMSPIPEIHLLLMSTTAVTAFKDAKKKYLDPIKLGNAMPRFHIHEASLSQLEQSVKFDLIVSPANSYGILDGGMDDAISRAFSPRNNYVALTGIAQDKLHREWKGFAPPGTCTLVDLPSEWTDSSRAPEARSKNVRGTKYLALLPTMRVPSDVNWDREVVYECIWSLLNCVYNHNQAATSEQGKVKSLLMSPLATGAGYVSEERWASQTCLAIKHFIAAVNGPEKAEGEQVITWPEASKISRKVEETWRKQDGKPTGSILPFVNS